MTVRTRALLLGFAFALTLGGCGKPAAKPQGPAPLAVDVAKATQQDIATYLTLDGQVAPLQESTLSSTQSGTLAAVYVTEGQHVVQGQLLAKLDDAALRAQLAQNQGLLEQARARLASSTLSQPIQSQQYASSLAGAQQGLDAARNRVATAAASLQSAELVAKQNQQLFTQGYVSQTALTQSQANYVAAQQEANNARSALQAAQSALASAKANLGQTQIDVQTTAANKGALQQAEASVALLRTQISQASIYAPFDGVVTQRFLDPGALASPSSPVVKVSQISTVYVNANVPDEDLAYVRRGTPVTFTSTSLPGKTFAAKIADVNSTPTQGTLSYRARVQQDNAEGLLRGGMLVTVSVRKAVHRAAIVVPRSAVFQNERGANVFTVEDAKAKALPVQVGLQTDALSEVLGGTVRAGTVVITTRPDSLQDGSVVAVAGAGAPPGAAPPVAPSTGAKPNGTATPAASARK
jgi:RND family efflux transporter MFP subunit